MKKENGIKMNKETSSSEAPGVRSENAAETHWATVCVHAAPLVQLFVSADNGCLHNELSELLPIGIHFRHGNTLLMAWNRVSSEIWILNL